ncbi:alkaline phosphatase D family protein [Pseudobacteriovorax antillogorgiicola]|uniref:Alkaline phosphatase D n=1 Tax=Pseudobacteriovorax antillogorgiicola TaxID=1513793 RepID=A0A1Y6BKX0_9BACT|nr:alkaline phosphatase D family protein [Pseudobacteriovorax antillogorgiicola]TCS54682.1 alkaline phosphatase D [Pseudobacteriovorax antillogorgiicola]SMF16577.1 alkaline phosphatase D [Pseudobacteriovorax antillogorgiicola]
MDRRTLIKGVAGITSASLSLPGSQLLGNSAKEFCIGLGSCLNNSQDGAILDVVRAYDPQLFLWLGDNIYGDTTNMSLLQRKYQRLADNPRFQKLRDHCLNLSIWDDHDYGANNAGQEYSKKKASREIFLNFWNIPDDDPRWSHPGIYGSYLLGDEGQSVHIILLDGRTFRSTTKWSPTGTMLGQLQWDWLADALEVTADVTIICSGIQVLADEHGYEGWYEFPKERERLFSLIRRSGRSGVIFVSGDQHWSELTRVNNRLDYPSFDFTASSLDQSWPLPKNSKRVGSAYGSPNFGGIRIQWDEDPQIVFEIIDHMGQRRMQHRVSLSSLQS